MKGMSVEDVAKRPEVLEELAMWPRVRKLQTLAALRINTMSPDLARQHVKGPIPEILRPSLRRDVLVF